MFNFDVLYLQYLIYQLYFTNKMVAQYGITRNSPGDDIPERDIGIWVNAPTEGFPWDDLRKILYGGQSMA